MKNYWLTKASFPKTYKDGTVIWLRQGRIKHRNGDKPACEYHDGARQWFKNGSLHRENGPACTYPDGATEWWLEGKKHRDLPDPACEYADGVKEYWVLGIQHYP